MAEFLTNAFRIKKEIKLELDNDFSEDGLNVTEDSATFNNDYKVDIDEAHLPNLVKNEVSIKTEAEDYSTLSNTDECVPVMEDEGLDPKVHQFSKDQSKRMSSSQVDGDGTKNSDNHEEDAEKSENTANEISDSATKPNHDVALESDNLIQLTLEEGETLHDIEMDSDKKSIKSENKEDTKDATNKKKEDAAAKPRPDNSGKTEEPRTGEGKEGARVVSSAAKSSQSQSKKSRSRNLWISNVSKTTRATELKQAFSAHGKVIGAKVVINAKQSGACCYGYVTMDTVEDADKCINKLNNTDFNGHIIRIEKVCPDYMNSIKLNPKLLNDKKEHAASEKTSKDEVGNVGETVEEPRAEEERERQKRKSKSRSSARSKERSRRSSETGRKLDPEILTYAQIKEQQERQTYRKRMIQEEIRRRREAESRRREEDSRRREIDRRQKSEAARLEREREKLRVEREKIEREKAEIIRLERENQKMEREKLELEKLKLQRDKIRLQADDHRGVKRPGSYRREDYEDRKRSTSDRRYEGDVPQMRFDPLGMTRDSRYNDQERDRSPHYIQAREGRERRSMTDHNKDGIKSSREHRHVDSSKESPRFERSSTGGGSTNTWGHPSGGMSNKSFSAGISGSPLMSPKPWTNKDGWTPNSHRWNSSGNMSRSSQLSSTPPFQGKSNFKLDQSCPPPPAIKTYSNNRFEYKSMNAIRKY